MKGRTNVLNLAVLLEDSARREPERPAVVQDDVRLSYAEVDAAARQVANLLGELGVGRGDRVALACPNVPAFPVVYYGILKAGAVVVPLDVTLGAADVAYHLRDSGATVLFCHEGDGDLALASAGFAGFSDTASCSHLFVITSDPAGPSPVPGTATLAAALARQPTSYETVPTEATDTAVVLYTSGTTGQPKGAELTHANMVLNALACHRLFGRVDDERHLVALPLFHTFGQTLQMNAGFGAGATLVLVRRFEARRALALMADEQVTFVAGVPTMFSAILAADRSRVDLGAISSRLRMAVSGGESLPVAVLEQVRDLWGVEIHEGYGLSETSPVACFNHPGRPIRPGSIGEPVWGVSMKLIDPDWREVPAGESGEVAIRGHNVMKGYLGRPEATAEVIRDGWFRTGDIARRDESGYYFVVDRAEDLILRGGFNVYPRELEEVIMTHPEVRLVAVVGVPHPDHGEEVKAFVVCHAGSGLTQPELVAWCRSRMALYKYPRLVEFRHELPMTSTGKVLKRALQAGSAPVSADDLPAILSGEG